mgnify:FL=1
MWQHATKKRNSFLIKDTQKLIAISFFRLFEFFFLITQNGHTNSNTPLIQGKFFHLFFSPFENSFIHAPGTTNNNRLQYARFPVEKIFFFCPLKSFIMIFDRVHFHSFIQSLTINDHDRITIKKYEFYSGLFVYSLIFVVLFNVLII